MEPIQIKFFLTSYNKNGMNRAWYIGVVEVELLDSPIDDNHEYDQVYNLVEPIIENKIGWRNLQINGFGRLPNGNYIAMLRPF